MSDRPYVLLSCAASIDGHIDDTTDQRLLLSNDEDFDRVDAVRATCDAILVGAETIRKDNPRLLVRSEQRQTERTNQGRTPTPVKVTLTNSGNLDATARFFSTGDIDKLVYAPTDAVDTARKNLADTATVTDVGQPLDLTRVLSDLANRGIQRLMIEGGGTIHTQFLTAGLADELHLVIAPFFVGNDQAPRFVNPGTYPNTPTIPLHLAETQQIGNVVLLRYLTATPTQ